MNLVSLRDGPVKSEELLMYEKNLQKKPETPPALPPAGALTIPKQPADPAGAALPKAGGQPVLKGIIATPKAATLSTVLAGFGASVL